MSGDVRSAMVRRIATWAGASLWVLFAFYHGLLALGSSLLLPPSIAGAVFYALTLCAMSARPQASLFRVGGVTLLAASLPELFSTAATHVAMPSRWLVEVAAVVGALLPVVLERARSRRAASLGSADRPVRAMRAEVRRPPRPHRHVEPERVVIEHVPSSGVAPTALIAVE